MLLTNTTWTPENGTQTSTGVSWSSNYQTTSRSYYDESRAYYNFRAVTAGTTNEDTVSGDANGTVCPQAWTLPTRSEYVNLVTTVYSVSGSNDAKLHALPFSFNYAGYYNPNTIYNSDMDGYFWSRSIKDASSSYYLFFRSNAVTPQGSSYGRVYGFPARCLAKP